MSAIIGKITAFICLIATTALTIVAVFLRGRKEGQDQEKEKQNEEVLSSVKKINEAINSAENTNIDARLDFMRKNYTRD